MRTKMYTGYHHKISDSEDDNFSLKNKNKKKLDLYKENDRKHKKNLSRDNSKNDSSYDEFYETKRKRLEEIGSKFRSDREKYRIKANKKIEKKKVLNFLSLDAEEEDINKRWQHSKYEEYEGNNEINRKKYKDKNYLYCGEGCNCRIYKNCSLFKKIYKKMKKKKNKKRKKLRSPSTTSSSSSSCSKSSSLSTSSLIKIRERLLRNLKLKNSNTRKRKIPKNSSLNINKLINTSKTSLNENFHQKINSRATKKNLKNKDVDSSDSQDDVFFVTNNIPPNISKNKIKFNLSNKLTNNSNNNNNTHDGDYITTSSTKRKNSETMIKESNSPKVNKEFVSDNDNNDISPMKKKERKDHKDQDINGSYHNESSDATSNIVEEVTKSPSLASIQPPLQTQPSKSSQTMSLSDQPSTPPLPKPTPLSTKATRVLRSSATQTSLTTHQKSPSSHSSTNASPESVKRYETSASSTNDKNGTINDNKNIKKTKSSANQTKIVSNNNDQNLKSASAAERKEEEIIINDSIDESASLPPTDNVKNGGECVNKSNKTNKVSLNIKKTAFVRMANGFAGDDTDDDEDDANDEQKCHKNKLLIRFLDEQQNKSLKNSNLTTNTETSAKKNLHLRKKNSSVSDSNDSSCSNSSRSSRSSSRSSRFSRSRSNSSSSSNINIKSGYRSLSTYSSSTTSSIASMRKRLYRGKREKCRYDRKSSYSRSRSRYSSDSSRSTRSRTSSSYSSCSSYRASKRKYKNRSSHSNSKCRKK